MLSPSQQPYLNHRPAREGQPTSLRSVLPLKL